METIRLTSRDAILAAALELFAENPGTSLAAVAARAGVGRATLHRHFASRDELIRELALAALDATDAAVAGLEEEPDPQLALEQMFERLVPLADRFHFLARLPVQDPEIDRRYAAQIEGLATLVARLRERGVVDASVPDAWMVRVADSLIWDAWSAVAEGSIPARDATALAVRTFLHGLGGERHD
ncbi:MAG: TetR family transcriptional regulator [Proteobacteria bacterium]|nr:TetR family transcriptional regulator [Pseudomonadota bacterium]